MQNSRTLRRLAADHGALHSQPLPPNYLFPPGGLDNDDLTLLDILLAGPTHTPFATGVWKLHLSIPSTYPHQPPTANFRTSIFHPNVDPQTGGVCVETLKRDWDSTLTLRDVLVTISCLLIQPNPDSALNAEAGALIQEDYAAFSRRAELMTSIHAVVPKGLQEAVSEAQCRGQETAEEREEASGKQRNDVGKEPDVPVRRRGATARQRGTATSRRSDGSPTGGVIRRRQQAVPANPFVVQSGNDDIFGVSRPPHRDQTKPAGNDDSDLMDEDQENDESRSPTKAPTPRVRTPKRPQGAPVPLGELTLEEVADDSSDEEDEDAEPEYPPSPRKCPSKSPAKLQQPPHINNPGDRPESSRAAAARGAPNITPPNNLTLKPLAENSPFAISAAHATPSPRKNRSIFNLPSSKGSATRAPLFPALGTPGGVFKTKKSPSSSEKKKRKAELDAKLWELCGRDIGRWNRGDFDGEPFGKKARRW